MLIDTSDGRRELEEREIGLRNTGLLNELIYIEKSFVTIIITLDNRL